MNREHFMTCIRAYFPGAKASRHIDLFGKAQTITLRHAKISPHCLTVYNYYARDAVLVFPGKPTLPIYHADCLPERWLLRYLKKYNKNGWEVV